MKESTRTILGFMSVAALVMSIIALTASTGHCQSLTKESFLKPQPLDTSVWTKPAMTIASSAACFGGVSADLLTSRGLIEGNPFLRRANGSPNLLRAGLIGFGSCGATYLLQSKHPKLAALLRIGIGSAHGLVAVHNGRLK